MVGIVVVSHSRRLAHAAVALAREMVGESGVRIEIAAGLGDEELGTDATAVVAAIRAADGGDPAGGVVVLMDLGSAVLSAELALELLDVDTRRRVTLCPGPFVEGLVIAAVAAGNGADRGQVASEAAAALTPKLVHLGSADR